MTDSAAWSGEGVTESILVFCAGLVGDCSLVADRSWPHRESVVLEVRDERGRHWIAKRCRQREHFDQETRAYREWVPSLGDRAPELVGHDPRTGTMLLTFHNGSVNTTHGPATYHQAGALIRRFHDAAPPEPGHGFAERIAERVQRALAEGRGVFSRDQERFLAGLADPPSRLPAPRYVPVHMDNQPRNWLVDDRGTVRLIDFGLSRTDVWVRDLVRMHSADWRADRAYREAFLDGYGRRPDEAEARHIQLLSAVSAATTVLWARQRDDAEFEAVGWRALSLAQSDAQ